MRTLWALVSGALFGAGLATSQMTNPLKVKAFLDVAGSWDPSLALVMGAAVGVSAAGVALDRLRRARRSGMPFSATAAVQGPIDARLLFGAALFGLGWGLAGLCPGPAIAALVTGSPQIFVFVIAMALGMGLHAAGESSLVRPPGSDRDRVRS